MLSDPFHTHNSSRTVLGKLPAVAVRRAKSSLNAKAGREMLSKKRRRGARFGLAAYAYSCMPAPSGGAETLEYGIVGINRGIIPIEIAPFGSMKECGIGRWLEPVKVQTDA